MNNGRTLTLLAAGTLALAGFLTMLAFILGWIH